MKNILRNVAVAAALLVVTSASQAQSLFVAYIDGATEGTPSLGHGVAWVTLTGDFMRIQTHFSGLTGNVTASHIHAPTPAPFSGTAGVATQTPTFTGFPSGVKSGTYDHTFDLTQASTYRAGFITSSGGTVAGAEAVLVQALWDNKAYLNIHTNVFGGGEIRGFFQAVPEPGSVAMFVGMGAGSLLALRRRRKK